MTALGFIGSAAMQMIIGAWRVFPRDSGTVALIRLVRAVAWTLGLAGDQ